MRAFCHSPKATSNAPSSAVTVPIAAPVANMAPISPYRSGGAPARTRRYDDPMAFLARDRARPKASEINSCPPRERHTRQGQPHKRVRSAVAKMPERFLCQHLRGPGRKQNRSRYNRDAVGLRGPDHDVFSVRPDPNDATAQLMSLAIQISANNWDGQAGVLPLQSKANNWLGS